jgi:aryl-alcohol dehydrogenase-like predicted oxidoreductase
MSIRRRIGDTEVTAIGLGCMNLSHAYGPPIDRDQAVKLLNRALDIGYDLFDTATLYGDGDNERLLGSAIMHRRDEFFLASKGVLGFVAGKRTLDGRPEAIKAHCDASLARLNTDVIDLYYMHRLDRGVPIEDSVGAMSDLVRAGKIRHIGLSEVSAATVRRAHATHPIAAVQSEYSLWTRNPEIAVLDACRELGIALVAFSPVARGYLTDAAPDPSRFHDQDIRKGMPRFSADNYVKNLVLRKEACRLAERIGCTLPQLALAWVLAQGENLIAIPGTTRLEHLEQNFRSMEVTLPPDFVDALTAHFAPSRIAGNRYSDAAQRAIDTETFEFEGYGKTS